MIARISTLRVPTTERASRLPVWRHVVDAVEEHWRSSSTPATRDSVVRLLGEAGADASEAAQLPRLARCGWLEFCSVSGVHGYQLTAMARAELERMRGQGEVAA